ncbi:arylamine N-acetyltransferase family protein [Celerinatantimonas yamalensis]|uniref:Arylamine N-acetyltransferase n=1 Tax=Celerinatantimonas yamalensis TaxID=559956 RepID=A0ABW9G2E8_9GAMM
MLSQSQQQQYLSYLQQDIQPPSRCYLSALHQAHLQRIAFENLDILRDQPICLNMDQLLDKFICQHRGGLCFELNYAFGLLLKSLGFSVQWLSAEVWDGEQFGSEVDHLFLRLDIDDSAVIADVGFGCSYLTPLQLQMNSEQGTHRLIQQHGYWVWQKRHATQHWQPCYRFRLNEHPIERFYPLLAQCLDETSLFKQRLICSRATPSGRVSIRNNQFTQTQDGVQIKRHIFSQALFESILMEHFGFKLPSGVQLSAFGIDR